MEGVGEGWRGLGAGASAEGGGRGRPAWREETGGATCRRMPRRTSAWGRHGEGERGGGGGRGRTNLPVGHFLAW